MLGGRLWDGVFSGGGLPVHAAEEAGEAGEEDGEGPVNPFFGMGGLPMTQHFSPGAPGFNPFRARIVADDEGAEGEDEGEGEAEGDEGEQRFLQMPYDEENEDDLLVVASRGHRALTGMVLGSVSQHCVTHAACPVVVYREPKPGA